jgi:hypothetical protein
MPAVIATALPTQNTWRVFNCGQHAPRAAEGSIDLNDVVPGMLTVLLP